MMQPEASYSLIGCFLSLSEQQVSFGTFILYVLVSKHTGDACMLLRLVFLSELKSARPFLKVPPSIFFKMLQKSLEEEKPRGC